MHNPKAQTLLAARVFICEWTERHVSRFVQDMSKLKPKSPLATASATTRPQFIDNSGHMDPAHRERLLKRGTAAKTKDPLPFRSQGHVEPIIGENLAAQTVTSMTSGEQEGPASSNALEDLTEVSLAEVLDGSR